MVASARNATFAPAAKTGIGAASAASLRLAAGAVQQRAELRRPGGGSDASRHSTMAVGMHRPTSPAAPAAPRSAARPRSRVRSGGGAVEVVLRRGLHAEHAGAEFDDVQVDLQDPLLRPQQRDLRRQPGFQQLAHPVAPLPQQQIARHLHGDGAGAARPAAVPPDVDLLSPAPRCRSPALPGRTDCPPRRSGCAAAPARSGHRSPTGGACRSLPARGSASAASAAPGRSGTAGSAAAGRAAGPAGCAGRPAGSGLPAAWPRRDGGSQVGRWWPGGWWPGAWPAGVMKSPRQRRSGVSDHVARAQMAVGGIGIALDLQRRVTNAKPVLQRMRQFAQPAVVRFACKDQVRGKCGFSGDSSAQICRSCTSVTPGTLARKASTSVCGTPPGTASMARFTDSFMTLQVPITITTPMARLATGSSHSQPVTPIRIAATTTPTETSASPARWMNCARIFRSCARSRRNSRALPGVNGNSHRRHDDDRGLGHRLGCQ